MGFDGTILVRKDFWTQGMARPHYSRHTPELAAWQKASAVMHCGRLLIMARWWAFIISPFPGSQRHMKTKKLGLLKFTGWWRFRDAPRRAISNVSHSHKMQAFRFLSSCLMILLCSASKRLGKKEALWALGYCSECKNLLTKVWGFIGLNHDLAWGKVPQNVEKVLL